MNMSLRSAFKNCFENGSIDPYVMTLHPFLGLAQKLFANQIFYYRHLVPNQISHRMAFVPFISVWVDFSLRRHEHPFLITTIESFQILSSVALWAIAFVFVCQHATSKGNWFI